MKTNRKENIIELEEGSYTGILKNIIETEHFIISTTNYLASECNNSLHSHKNPHICLLYQGADIESREDLIPYKRNAGEIFYYSAGEKHKTISTVKDSKNINIEIKQNTLTDFGISLRTDFNFESNNPGTRLLTINILEELVTNDNTSCTSLETLSLQLIEAAGNNSHSCKPDWVLSLEEYLHDNWNREFSLIQLAEDIGVHPITISKNFRKHYSCTYGQYRRMLKIDKSIPLIKNNEMSLTEIAFHCGFSDQSHFIRNFKKFSGFLPKDFQRL